MMNTLSQAPSERINLRLPPHIKQLIERAAGFEGKTLSSFILGSVLAQAEKTVLEHEVIHLSGKDSQAFLQALEQPVRFNDKLTAAMQDYKRRVVSQ